MKNIILASLIVIGICLLIFFKPSSSLGYSSFSISAGRTKKQMEIDYMRAKKFNLDYKVDYFSNSEFDRYILVKPSIKTKVCMNGCPIDEYLNFEDKYEVIEEGDLTIGKGNFTLFSTKSKNDKEFHYKNGKVLSDNWNLNTKISNWSMDSIVVFKRSPELPDSIAQRINALILKKDFKSLTNFYIDGNYLILKFLRKGEIFNNADMIKHRFNKNWPIMFDNFVDTTKQFQIQLEDAYQRQSRRNNLRQIDK